MWNPTTNRIVTTGDIIWLKRTYFEPEKSVGIKLDSNKMTVDAIKDTNALNNGKIESNDEDKPDQ